MESFMEALTDQGRCELVDQMVFNKKIAGGYSLRRPDAMISLSTHNIILEVDENQATYHFDKERDETLWDDSRHNNGQPKPVVFLRLNPDAYNDFKGKRHVSCFEPVHPVTALPYVPEDRDPDYQRRIQATVDAFLELYDGEPPTKKITRHYLYFNGHKG